MVGTSSDLLGSAFQRLVAAAPGLRCSATCPVCLWTSHNNPGDAQDGYCGRCHAFTGSCPVVNPADAAVLQRAGWRPGLDYRVGPPVLSSE